MVEIYLVYLFISAVEILRSRNEIHSAKAAIKYSEQAQIWKGHRNTSNHTAALFLFLWCDQKCSNFTDSDTYAVFEFAFTDGTVVSGCFVSFLVFQLETANYYRLFHLFVFLRTVNCVGKWLCKPPSHYYIFLWT